MIILLSLVILSYSLKELKQYILEIGSSDVECALKFCYFCISDFIRLVLEIKEFNNLGYSDKKHKSILKNWKGFV